jgi:hypothetical protein
MDIKKKKIKYLAVACIFFLTIAATALAASTNTYTGCLEKNGVLDYVAIGSVPAASCKVTQVTWNEIGPIGLTGAAGAQGPIGPIGPRGPIGLTGAAGPIGPIGPIGLTGAQGPIGPQGTPGNDGAAGAQGPMGPPGPKGDTGATGPQGQPGATGPAGTDGAVGPQGPVGAPGQPGISGYEQVIGSSLYLNANQGGYAWADCPYPKNVLGGGGLAASPQAYIVSSYPIGFATWEVYYMNTGSSSSYVTPYAICANVQ